MELNRLRCKNCNTTLLFHKIDEGTFEIMCRNKRCKLINRVECESGVCLTRCIGIAVDKTIQYV